MDESLPLQDKGHEIEEARFFDYSLDIFYVTDLNGIIHGVNHAVERTLGFHPEELQGRSVFEFVHAEDQETARSQLHQLRQGRDTVRFDCRARCRDGSYRWLSVTCPAPPAESQLLHAVARDITQQKQTEQSLLEWKNRYEAATELTRNIVYEWNTEEDEVIWGGKPEAFLGFRRDELPTDVASWLEMIHPDDRFDAERVVEDVLVDKAAVHLEYRIRRKNGEYVWIRDDAQYFSEADGRLVRMVGVITDISKETAAVQVLYRVADAAPSAVLLIDAEGRILFLNGESERAFGYPRQEMEGMPIEELIPQRYHHAHHQSMRAFLGDPQTREMASRKRLFARHRDGHEIPVEIRLTPIPFGTEMMVACTVIESTPTVRIQRALQESEQRLRSILDNTSAVIYAKDIDGRYLLANRQFEQLFGIDGSDLIGQTDFDLFPHEMAEAFRKNDRRVAASGEILRLEEVAPHPDGPHNYISVKFPLRDASNTIYAIAGISTDITDLTKTRREVEQLTHRMELILNSVTDGIFEVNLQGVITFANRSAGRLFGGSVSELIGQQHQSITSCSPAADGAASNAIASALAGGATSLVEDEQFQRMDGTCFPVEYVAAPVRDNDEIIGAVVTFTEISERQNQARAENELRAARTLQQQLYPDAAPHLEGFDLAGAAVPAAMAGGDYYDFVPLTDDKVALAVGDVSGHGLSSALQMIEVRAYLRAILSAEQDLSTVLERLNRFLIGDTLEGAFVSLFLAQLDSTAKTLSYIGAGHDARLIRANGDVEALTSSGIVLGVVQNLSYARSTTVRMEPGDVLVVVTDGITEAHSLSSQLFEYSRVLDVVRDNCHSTAESIIGAIYAAVSDFSEGRALHDDMTAMIVKAL